MAMATSQLQDCKYKIIPSIISCLFCSIMNYSLIPMFIKLTTRTHRHPEHTHTYIIYVFINTHTYKHKLWGASCIWSVPVWPVTKDASLRAWSRLTAHYQVLPCSHQYYRVRPTPSSSRPLCSQSHPWKDRQKSFICSKNTTVKREERRGEEIVFW